MALLSNTEQELLELINEHRTAQGKTPLSTHPSLQNYSSEHLKEILAGKEQLSNQDFPERAKELVALLRPLRLRAAAENLDKGPEAPQQLMEQWLADPLYRKNVEGDYNLASISRIASPEGSYLYYSIFLKTKEARLGKGKAPGPGRPMSIDLDDMGQEVFRLINAYRQEKGLPALSYSLALNEMAHQHSKVMASGEHPFSHGKHVERLTEAMVLLKGHRAAENLYKGPADAQKMLDFWLQSPGHRKNIEKPHTHTGLDIEKGVDGQYYCTHIFVKVKS